MTRGWKVFARSRTGSVHTVKLMRWRRIFITSELRLLNFGFISIRTSNSVVSRHGRKKIIYPGSNNQSFVCSSMKKLMIVTQHITQHLQRTSSDLDNIIEVKNNEKYFKFPELYSSIEYGIIIFLFTHFTFTFGQSVSDLGLIINLINN